MSRTQHTSLRSIAIIGTGAALIQALAGVGPLFTALFTCTEGPGITIITDGLASAVFDEGGGVNDVVEILGRANRLHDSAGRK